MQQHHVIIPSYFFTMEGKDCFVLFFAILSALLFGCLAFSVLHNASQIAQLQQQLQEISDECHNDDGSNMQTSQQEILAKLLGEISEKVSKTDQNAKGYALNDHIRRQLQDATNLELSTTTSTAATTITQDPDGALEGTVTLLANALLDIVDSQLKAKLDCDEVDDTTQCTILPGPKGEKGDRGRRGRAGDRGRKGDTGEKGQIGFWGPPGPPGLNGVNGSQGVTGEPGEKGSQGERGPRGPVGSKGDKGEIGEPGEIGERGYPGPRGLRGLRGPPGPDRYSDQDEDGEGAAGGDY